MTTERSTINWTDIHARLRAGEAALEAVLHPTESVIRGELARRAEQLARSNQAVHDDAAQRALSLLVFGIGEKKFAVELAHVEEIGAMHQCTPVPGASDDLCGIMHHQGELRSVIDMAHRLGLETQSSTSGGYFLHLRATDGANRSPIDLLFRVPELDQILNIDPHELMSDPLHEHQTLGRLVRAICPQGIILLDADKLCADSIPDSKPAEVAPAAQAAGVAANDEHAAHRKENLP